MIVCLCANVSEREVVATIASGAITLKDVARRCGAGGSCGSCQPMIRAYLARLRGVAARGKQAPDVDLASV